MLISTLLSSLLTSSDDINQASQFLAFFVGFVFLLVQVLSYQGYVTVNYEKLKQDVEVGQDNKCDVMCVKMTHVFDLSIIWT